MTRILLDENTAIALRAAAAESTDPVELVAPDGVVLMRSEPANGAYWSPDELEEIYRARESPAPTYTSAEVREMLERGEFRPKTINE